MLHRLALLLLVATVLWLAPLRIASAAQFDIAPVSLSLSDKTSSGTLVLTNRSSEALRFHVTVFSWSQRADGEMVLNPTNDIVFFPAMLTLNPKQSRQLRVGMKVKAGATEKTYRLFVQELPPLVKSKEDEPNAVRVLTKMGLPIFIEPSGRAKPVPAVSGLAVKGDALSFDIKNAGNAHMRVEKSVITVKDGAAKVIHTQEAAGWYVLAGGTRTYAVALPKAACASAKAIEVAIESSHGPAKAALSNEACGP
jgi:fimbrial chaperone protein